MHRHLQPIIGSCSAANPLASFRSSLFLDDLVLKSYRWAPQLMWMTGDEALAEAVADDVQNMLFNLKSRTSSGRQYEAVRLQLKWDWHPSSFDTDSCFLDGNTHSESTNSNIEREVQCQGVTLAMLRKRYKDAAKGKLGLRSVRACDRSLISTRRTRRGVAGADAEGQMTTLSREDHSDREEARRPRYGSRRDQRADRLELRYSQISKKAALQELCDRKDAKYQTALLEFGKMEAECLMLKEEPSALFL
ncbi:hypothetical protein C8R44DRAFT_866495 [Mycena epipterygia]|nr:hypothetical protein C8R44DRAFT_866495 [Mycena epipterygia]